jgi:2-polyprenyl-3-methyl-5-hydroxy-6-metoxy-1,4-benzoquinol methylase
MRGIMKDTSKLEIKEKQYSFMVEQINEKGPVNLTCRASSMWRTDPKLLSFTLARHKFVAKMLNGYSQVLEIGCGDGFASRLLHDCVKDLYSIDFDEWFINEAQKNADPSWPVKFQVHDILSRPYVSEKKTLFDAAFSLDVIEHIEPKFEDLFLLNIAKSIKIGGVFVCGSPSLESQTYASQASKDGHVNCKNGNDLKILISNYFDHTFLFGMNDEVLHTGFTPMCHYNFIIAVGRKKL